MPMNIDPDSASHNGSAISSSNDPLRGARQAIRSQVTAREYTERQLVQAQNVIEELRIKLRHVHHEREVALSAAQSAIAARDVAERSTRAAETALTSERANRARIEGMLRDAETTIRDLREKLATANQTMQVERAAERLNRSTDDGVIVEPEAIAPTVRDGGLPVVKRPVGRLHKVPLAQPVPTMIRPGEEPPVIRNETVPPNVNNVASASRRPVGIPRKLVAVEPIQALAEPSGKAQASGNAVARLTGSVSQKDRGQRPDDQEPVQWWVEGWRNK
jgi:hypothetical protein